MVSQFSDRFTFSKPHKTYYQHEYDDKHASFYVKEMFEYFKESIIENFS